MNSRVIKTEGIIKASRKREKDERFYLETENYYAVKACGSWSYYSKENPNKMIGYTPYKKEIIRMLNKKEEAR